MEYALKYIAVRTEDKMMPRHASQQTRPVPSTQSTRGASVWPWTQCDGAVVGSRLSRGGLCTAGVRLPQKPPPLLSVSRISRFVNTSARAQSISASPIGTHRLRISRANIPGKTAVLSRVPTDVLSREKQHFRH